LTAITAVVTLSGCGFIAAGQASHQKPNTFVLYGHVDVSLSASEHRATGTACMSPDTVAGIEVTTPVAVLSPGGATIAHGSLGAGVIARTGDAATCDFPFQIRDVPGGADSYQIAVGDRPAQVFPAAELQHNTPAVIAISR
jgi:hypothetical protein